MSAIWGAIQLEKNILPVDLINIMEKPFHACIIDRFETINEFSVQMGCGIQYFNKESIYEKLPIGRTDVYFDADVVLDNRDELLKKLKVDETNAEVMSDGEILFRMLNAFGDSCLNDILGAYTFVYYDKKDGEVKLVCDAVGNRTLYYKIEGGILFYSSLLEGINSASPSDVEDKWFVDFFSMDFLTNCSDEELTPYKNIKRVPSATEIIVTIDGIKKSRYWNPLENFKVKEYKNDDEIKSVFLDLWKKAVKCVMRTEDEVALLLSGGLDSTAVASEASKYQMERGKKLFSYTSVPLDEYDSSNKKRTDDETEDVLKSVEFYGNIEPTFLKMEGVNAWNGYDEQMNISEMPYKANQNALWMQEACNQARKKGVRILLTGAYGNNSISFSGIRNYGNHLFKTLQWIKLYKYLCGYKNTIGMSRKKAVKGILQDVFIKEHIPKNVFGDSNVNREYAKKYGSDKMLEKLYEDTIAITKKCKESNYSRLDWLAMRQTGELNMKKSLFSGVLIRDPSIDKRIIEFCLTLPYEQYVKDGIDRRLVRHYLKEQIPDHINRINRRGRQSADDKLRIELDWDNIYMELRNGYNDNTDFEMINVLDILKELNAKDCIKNLDSTDINRYIYTLKAIEFYKNHKVVTIIDR